MTGFTGIIKPQGITSFDIVRKIKKVFGEKTGHFGTLDPFATGILVIALGRATRLSQFYDKENKVYTAKIRLGIQTDTLDNTGEAIIEKDYSFINKNDVEKVLQKFVGRINQVPPIYSAIKIDGKRAYELARKKIIPDRIPEREVVIENITLLHFELPEITIEVKCFSGTYIRSLARDIAERLGSCGHLTYLNRMNDGFFNYENSASFEEFISDPIKHICKINNIINFPVFNLEDEIIKKIKNGMECKISYEINDDFVFAADKNNDLIFLCKVKEKNILCPEVYLEDNK